MISCGFWSTRLRPTPPKFTFTRTDSLPSFSSSFSWQSSSSDAIWISSFLPRFRNVFFFSSCFLYRNVLNASAKSNTTSRCAPFIAPRMRSTLSSSASPLNASSSFCSSTTASNGAVHSVASASICTQNCTLSTTAGQWYAIVSRAPRRVTGSVSFVPRRSASS